MVMDGWARHNLCGGGDGGKVETSTHKDPNSNVSERKYRSCTSTSELVVTIEIAPSGKVTFCDDVPYKLIIDRCVCYHPTTRRF